MKKSLLNLILTLISFLIGLILCEITGRFIGLGNPILYEIDPIVGYRLKPNQKVRRLKNKYINTDREGFRVSIEKKDLNSKEIIFIGDSVTYGGSYIDNKELFSQLYCQISKENDYCLNGAINSWGTQNMGRLISNFNNYSTIKPKEFILVILPGDERRNLRSFTDTPYWSNNPKQPSAINEVLKFIITKKFVPALQTKPKNSLVSKRKDLNFINDMQRKIAWEELQNQLAKSKYPINLIITPPERWFTNTNQNLKEIEIYNDLLKDISDLETIKKTCNLYLQTKDIYKNNLYVDGVHLSKEGHKVWAQSIRSCLALK